MIRVLTQLAHDTLVSQGRIQNGMLRIDLPEPGGARIYEPVRIGLSGESAWDYGAHTGWRHILVTIPSDTPLTEQLSTLLSPYGKDKRIDDVLSALSALACSDDDFAELLRIFIRGFEGEPTDDPNHSCDENTRIAP